MRTSSERQPDDRRARRSRRGIRALVLGLAVGLGLGGGACATATALSSEDRLILQSQYTQSPVQRHLKLSYYVTPFFGDASKKLLTPVPPEQVRLLETPGGETISPGGVERIVPAGRRVRVLKVEFPTSWSMTERLIYTPRSEPWVYLEIEGEPKTHPYILVLRGGHKTADQFRAELERYLTERDVEERMSNWPESVREGIRSKTAVVDMPADALEMAWGYPERKQIAFEDSVRVETWIYPGDRRVAVLRDGRVERVQDAGG